MKRFPSSLVLELFRTKWPVSQFHTFVSIYVYIVFNRPSADMSYLKQRLSGSLVRIQKTSITAIYAFECFAFTAWPRLYLFYFWFLTLKPLAENADKPFAKLFLWLYITWRRYLLINSKRKHKIVEVKSLRILTF